MTDNAGRFATEGSGDEYVRIRVDGERFVVVKPSIYWAYRVGFYIAVAHSVVAAARWVGGLFA